MPFTETDLKEIADIVGVALDRDRARRREWALANPQVIDKETKLYLITLMGHQIAFPDESGRAVLHQTLYANIELNKKDPHFHGGRIEVIAYGDGRKLKEPIGIVLGMSSLAAIVEVPADFLKTFV